MIGLGLLRAVGAGSWMMVGGAVAAFALGMTTQGVLKDGKINKLRLAVAECKGATAKAEVGERARVAPISERAVEAATEGKAEVRWRTRTLVERVRVVVPEAPSDHVIRGGDLVPLGALGLLDAAATPEAITSGESPERSAPVTFTRLTTDIIDNYGIAHGWREQCSSLISWEKEVGSTR